MDLFTHNNTNPFRHFQIDFKIYIFFSKEIFEYFSRFDSAQIDRKTELVPKNCINFEIFLTKRRKKSAV